MRRILFARGVGLVRVRCSGGEDFEGAHCETLLVLWPRAWACIYIEVWIWLRVYKRGLSEVRLQALSCIS